MDEVDDGSGVTAGRPKVTAVVLNWCDEFDTAACVASLLESDYGNLQVLLVDNGSPDGSGERLRRHFPQVPFLQTGSNLGYTGGNNRGIEQAIASGAAYVLVLNNDTTVASDCISHLVNAAQGSSRIAAVGPKILFFDEPKRIWFGGGELSRMRAVGTHRNLGQSDMGEATSQEVTFLTGCCLLIPVSIVQNAGVFREDFFAYIEDVEYSIRLRKAGYQLWYEPAARVYHRIEVDPPAPSPFQIRHRDRNRRRLVREHYSLLSRVLFYLWFFPTRLIHLVVFTFRGDTERARAIIEGMFRH